MPVIQVCECGPSFTIAYCDLDNFKPFNDVYGYKKGDQVLNQFQSEIPGFYREEHLNNGGITTVDRNGEHSVFPILSLSIGAVCPVPEYCSSHHEVATLATDAK